MNYITSAPGGLDLSVGSLAKTRFWGQLVFTAPAAPTHQGVSRAEQEKGDRSKLRHIARYALARYALARYTTPSLNQILGVLRPPRSQPIQAGRLGAVKSFAAALTQMAVKLHQLSTASSA